MPVGQSLAKFWSCHPFLLLQKKSDWGIPLNIPYCLQWPENFKIDMKAVRVCYKVVLAKVVPLYLWWKLSSIEDNLQWEKTFLWKIAFDGRRPLRKTTSDVRKTFNGIQSAIVDILFVDIIVIGKHLLEDKLLWKMIFDWADLHWNKDYKFS